MIILYHKFKDIFPNIPFSHFAILKIPEIWFDYIDFSKHSRQMSYSWNFFFCCQIFRAREKRASLKKSSVWRKLLLLKYFSRYFHWYTHTYALRDLVKNITGLKTNKTTSVIVKCRSIAEVNANLIFNIVLIEVYVQYHFASKIRYLSRVCDAISAIKLAKSQRSVVAARIAYVRQLLTASFADSG